MKAVYDGKGFLCSLDGVDVWTAKAVYDEQGFIHLCSDMNVYNLGDRVIYLALLQYHVEGNDRYTEIISTSKLESGITDGLIVDTSKYRKACKDLIRKWRREILP